MKLYKDLILFLQYFWHQLNPKLCIQIILIKTIYQGRPQKSSKGWGYPIRQTK